MNKVTELENALTELFRKGTEVGYSETEIDEFLEDIDYLCPSFGRRFPYPQRIH